MAKNSGYNNEPPVIHEKMHGTDDFPVSVTFNDSEAICSNRGNFVYCHWHSEFELNLITSGRTNFEVDGKTLSAEEDDIVLINSGEVHCGYTPDNSRCCLYGIVFDLGLLSGHNTDIVQSKYLDPLMQLNYKLPSLIKGSSAMGRKLSLFIKEILLDYQSKTYGYELKTKAMLMCILSLIISNKMLIPQEVLLSSMQEKLESFKTILKYIEENHTDRIYVKDLAAAASMSEDNFFKFFKRLSGETPITYINHLRIREAGRLLRETNRPILDIALTTGFENVSYFIKTFKTFNNATPRTYRKNFSSECL